MGFHLALVALLMFGVFADQPVGGATAKKKLAAEKAKAEADAAAAAAVKVLPTCQVQLKALGGEICPNSEQLEYDESKNDIQLDDESPDTAKDACCKKQITCAEFVAKGGCPAGHRQASGMERTRLPTKQRRGKCCETIPRFQFDQGINWIKHLNENGKKNKPAVWKEISKLDQRWWKDGEYWFRKCGNIYGTYVEEGDAATCVIGLEPDGRTINHLGPFGKGKTAAQVAKIFDTPSVVIGADWQPPPRRSFSKVGIIMESNEHHMIILAGSIVGLSAAFYMTYKYTKKNDAHYARLVDEEV